MLYIVRSFVACQTGLQPTDTDALKLERELNENSLMVLKGYYRSLRLGVLLLSRDFFHNVAFLLASRQFHLNQTMLPKDEFKRTLFLQQISQPLHAMEILVQQVETVVREAHDEGVGLHSLVSELSQRMGGISIWVCNSGVHRSQAVATLAQATTLVRSHGLVSWSLVPAVSCLRAVGALQFIEKRNEAATLPKAFPQPLPW